MGCQALVPASRDRGRGWAMGTSGCTIGPAMVCVAIGLRPPLDGAKDPLHWHMGYFSLAGRPPVRRLVVGGLALVGEPATFSVGDLELISAHDYRVPDELVGRHAQHQLLRSFQTIDPCIPPYH